MTMKLAWQLWPTLLFAIGCALAVPALAEHHEAVQEVESQGEAEATAPKDEVAEAATPATPPATTVGAEEGRVATPNVALARFTTAIEDLEPVDAVTFLTNDSSKIHFFTDLRGLEGSTITHRWEHGGEVMAEVPFEVQGSRWRVWSSKSLQPQWLGSWTVSVVKADGEVLATESFTYQAQP
jgi:hypothetical protein